ncbi:MAG: hypothetical protein KIT14_08445 [bacterium]|nr:hypothetical protein [bacterium]
MIPADDARAARVAALLVALVGIVHRVVLFLAYRDELRALIADNRMWYTGQNAPIALLHQDLGLTLLLLQASPPLSSLLIGLLTHVVSWPVAGAEVLTGLQGAITIATALLLHRLLRACFPGRLVLTTAVAIAFVLHTGVVVLEYNSFGQTIYENLAMLLTLGLAVLLLRVRRTGRARDAAWAGLVAGLLVLTRAVWSYVALPGALFVALLVPRARSRAVLAFLLPLVVLQGAWVAKNAWVFGRLSWVTSSWGGYNVTNGLDRLGYGDVFRQYLIARNDPPWLAEAMRHPAASIEAMVPPEYPRRDQELAARWGIGPWALNTTAAAALFDGFAHNFWHFALDRPDVVLDKTWRSYRLFWEPMANYGVQYVALFAPEATAASALDPAGVVRDLTTGVVPQQLGVTSGAFAFGRRLALRPASLGTPRWLDEPRLLATAIGVHLLAPLAALGWLVRRGRGPLPEPDATRAVVLLVCGTLIAYLALASSLGEHGENMRFRLGVEPLIWTVTLVGAAGAWRLVRPGPG